MANFLASGERLGLRVKEKTAASGDVVTVAECKKQAQVTASGDDVHIQLLINAAVLKFQQETGRQLLDRVFTLYLDTFPPYIKLPFPPFDDDAGVASVKYYDTAGTQQTLASSKYQVDDGGPDVFARIWPGIDDDWPSTELRRINAVEVEWTAGYGATGDVPELIKHCIRELVAETYIHRIPPDKVGAATIKIPMHAQDMLSSFRVYGW